LYYLFIQKLSANKTAYPAFGKIFNRMYTTDAPAAAPADASAANPATTKAEKERLRVEQAKKNITVVKPKLSQGTSA
jgi:hypothetical protein